MVTDRRLSITEQLDHSKRVPLFDWLSSRARNWVYLKRIKYSNYDNVLIEWTYIKVDAIIIIVNNHN